MQEIVAIAMGTETITVRGRGLALARAIHEFAALSVFR
jgi:hypothetical protein